MSLKRTPLKRTSRRKAFAHMQTGSGLTPQTMAAVYARTQGKCCCGCGQRVQRWNIACYHHVFSKQTYPALVNEPANVVGCFVDCHARHETAYKRLPRAAIAPAERLASTPRMLAYLERTYGLREA